MKDKLEELRQMRAKAKLGGGQTRIADQHAKGKLTARERIDLLLDSGTFQELGRLATHNFSDFGMADKKYPGDGVVTGFGKIDGRRVAVYAQDFTVLGGSFSEVQSHKVCKIMELAQESGIPVIGLLDSGGARIQEGVRSLAAYGELFVRNVMASGVIPQISVQMGPCAGGAVYSPALTDFIIMVRKTSFMFITGPDVIKAVTGEEVDFDTLGGAVAHNVAQRRGPLRRRRRDAPRSGWSRRSSAICPRTTAKTRRASPPTMIPARRDELLDHLVPGRQQRALRHAPGHQQRVRPGQLPGSACALRQERAGRLGPAGRLSRWAWSPTSRCTWPACWTSTPATRSPASCASATPSICRSSPWWTCPGYLPGVAQEHGGIIRHGAKVIYAYCEATVPKISVVVRKAMGGAYIAMSSKQMRTDLAYAWPTAEIAVMGPEGAINILYREEIKKAADPAALRKRLLQEYVDKFHNPYAAADMGQIDEVIEPSFTRLRLINALEILRSKVASNPPKKHGLMPV